jgi:hypothetical protein
MATRNEGPFAATSGEALEMDRLVKLSGNTAVYCDSGESPDGITGEKVAITKPVTIYPLKGNIERVTCAKAIAANTNIYPADDGKVSDAAVGGCIGKSMGQAATAANAIISAMVWRNTGAISGGIATSLIWVSPNGDDSGDGSLASPLLTIAAAVAAVTTARKTIMLLPGTYPEAFVWPSINGVSIRGLSGDSGAVIIGDESSEAVALNAETEIVLIDPTVQTSSFEAMLSNLTISAPGTVKGITVDNNNVGRKLILNLSNVSFEQHDETVKSLNVVHTVAGNAIKVYCNGRHDFMEGLLYIAPKNTDDRFEFTNMQFDGDIQFGTATIASVSTFRNCVVLDGGGNGGQDTQILNVLNCYSLTGTTYAIAALGDFAANAAEVILPAA